MSIETCEPCKGDGWVTLWPTDADPDQRMVGRCPLCDGSGLVVTPDGPGEGVVDTSVA